MPSKAVLENKKQQVAEFKDILKSKDGIYFFDYRGLKVSEFEELRRKVKESKGQCRVIKNSIASRSLSEEKIEVSDELLKGPNAVLYADDTYIEVAKVLVEFTREKEQVVIKDGFVERNYISRDKIIEISKLPSKEQMVAQLAMTISMPLKKFGMTLASPLKNIAILMNNLKDKKEKEEVKNG